MSTGMLSSWSQINMPRFSQNKVNHDVHHHWPIRSGREEIVGSHQEARYGIWLDANMTAVTNGGIPKEDK